MPAALEQTLFLLARSRLLLLELQDVERQLRRLAATPSLPEQPLLEEALQTLVDAIPTSRSARGRIEVLISSLEAEIDRSPQGP